MSAPVLHVLAGPNGSGKTAFAEEVLQPVTHLPFVNADHIAAQLWPGREVEQAHAAAEAAAVAREQALERGESFIAETVFSHPSKVALVERAAALGYLVELHVMLVPEELAVARVAYRRLWALVAQAIQVAQRSRVYDNSRAGAFAPVAHYELGQVIGKALWPAWTPPELTAW